MRHWLTRLVIWVGLLACLLVGAEAIRPTPVALSMGLDSAESHHPPHGRSPALRALADAVAALPRREPAPAVVDGPGLPPLSKPFRLEALAERAPVPTGTVDAGVCAWLPSIQLQYLVERQPGSKCVYDANNGRGKANWVWSGIADRECYSARLAQTACRANDAPAVIGAPPASYCGAGYEVNCRRYVSDVIADALRSGAPVYPAPATLCSGVTVDGVGYGAQALHDFQISRSCLQADAGISRTVSRCTFLGQDFQLNADFCRVLTTCVEPRLLDQFAVVGYSAETIPILDFPSGPQTLVVDLSCSTEARADSLHRFEQQCRAIDINAHQNYGNLRRDSRLTPVTTMPPAFVDAMEACGIVWGGRYIGSEGRWLGCDPMEFAYAPNCVDRAGTVTSGP